MSSFAEIGLVEAVESLYRDSGYEHVESCDFVPSEGAKAVSVSALLTEGVDFNLVYFPLKNLGYKAVMAVTGQLYAAMAHPKVLNISLAVSSKLDYPQVVDIWKGVLAAAKEHHYEQIGVELQPSFNGLVISLSASGEVSKTVLESRRKPQSKDLICVSSALGASYLGLSLLEKNLAEKKQDDELQKELTRYKMIVGAYLKPELEENMPQRLEKAGIFPTSGYFVRKGLADTVKKLSAKCGLGAKIYAGHIPFEGNSFELGKKLDIDTLSAAMNGGDDYSVLYVVPIEKAEQFRHDFQTFDIIGHLAQKDVGTVLVTPEGLEFPLKAQGWKEED